MAISNISLTASMRQNLLSLQKTQSLMDMTQNRLSTGKKVNSALDNATNFFAAAALVNRANDLDGLLDSMGQAVQTLVAADNGITSLTKLVDQAKASATSARDTQNVGATANAKVAIVDATNGTAAVDRALSTAANGDMIIRTGKAVEQVADAKSYKMDDLMANGFGALEIQIGDETTAITVNATAASPAEVTVEDYLESIERAGDGKLTARLTADGYIQIKSTDGSAISVTGTDAEDMGFDQGTKITFATASDTTAAKVIATINAETDNTGVRASWDIDTNSIKFTSINGDDIIFSGEGAVALNLTTSDTALSAATNGVNNRETYAKQYDDTLTQINQLVTNRDSGYKGTNLLFGDSLTVVFNESRTSTLEIQGVYADTKGLGIAKAQNDWLKNVDIDNSIAQLDKATNQLRLIATQFAQNLSTVQTREDFTKNMIETLTTGSDKLTLADMNEEGANMLALQTRQQLGVNALSLASQSAQSVLKLF